MFIALKKIAKIISGVKSLKWDLTIQIIEFSKSICYSICYFDI